MAGNIFRKPFKDEVNYVITSNFGNRLDPFGSGTTKHHSGMDLSAPDGTEIISVGDGIVYKVELSNTGLGNHVYIKHEYGETTFYSVYGHMLENSIVVSEGQIINEGDVIGIIGSTGASTGTHLHFTLTSPIPSLNKEYLVDPYYVIEEIEIENTGTNN